MKISLAPMQGYSDLIYRSTLCHIGGVDVFYAPYIKVEDGQIKNKHIADIEPKANTGLTVVPQVMANNSNDFLTVLNAVTELGYAELNWNLGCPFPMVAKRQLGAGLLPHPDIIDKVLTDVETNANLKISVKMRLGWQSEDEVWPVLDVLNSHKIEEITIHPRIGSQMYKGLANRQIMPQLIAKSAHPISYNGDICTPEQAQSILAENPKISHLMIGRGLLYNPFLANEIKGIQTDGRTRRNKLMDFIGTIGELQLDRLQGAGHFIQKMTTYWEYWSHMFTDQHKALKTIKKCRSIEEYSDKMQDIVLEWEMK